MLFRSLSASDKHAAGPFCSRETVACRDRIVVSTLRCGRSNPGSNPGHGRLLPSGSFLPPILQLDFVSEARWRPVLPSCSQGSWRAAARRSRGREVKAMDLKSIGVSPRRFEPCRLRVAFASLTLVFCADNCSFQGLCSICRNSL